MTLPLVDALERDAPSSPIPAEGTFEGNRFAAGGGFTFTLPQRQRPAEVVTGRRGPLSREGHLQAAADLLDAGRELHVDDDPGLAHFAVQQSIAHAVLAVAAPAAPTVTATYPVDALRVPIEVLVERLEAGAEVARITADPAAPFHTVIAALERLRTSHGVVRA